MNERLAYSLDVPTEDEFFGYAYNSALRMATDAEKEKLFEAIDKAGYLWIDDKKDLICRWQKSNSGSDLVYLEEYHLRGDYFDAITVTNDTTRVPYRDIAENYHGWSVGEITKDDLVMIMDSVGNKYCAICNMYKCGIVNVDIAYNLTDKKIEENTEYRTIDNIIRPVIIDDEILCLKNILKNTTRDKRKKEILNNFAESTLTWMSENYTKSF